jgi:hypothetical protein
MVGRGAAERPQRVLQAAGEGGEALAAEHDLGVLPAAAGQDEVVEPMRQGLAGDGHAEAGGVGEVGQALPAGRMLLAEDHLPGRAVQGAPGAHPALQGAPQSVPIALGVASLHLLQQGDGPQAWVGLQEREDVALPDPGQGVGDRAAGPGPGLGSGRRSLAALDAAGGALAEAGLGGGEALGVVASELHVELHLLACDVSSGHLGSSSGSSSWRARSRSCPNTPQPQAGAVARAAGRVSLRPGYARPPADPTGHPLLSRTGHPACRATCPRRSTACAVPPRSTGPAA